MYDVLLYATLAVIVCTVLFSVLGRQIGRGPGDDSHAPTRPEDVFGTTRDFTPDRAATGEAVVAPLSTLADAPAGVEAIRARDPEFDPAVFKDGATTAYSMVLEAFAEGDRDTLDMLLTPRMVDIYARAIADREAQNLTQVTDILRITDVDILAARLQGSEGEVDVAFHAELSSALMDSVGQAALGDPDVVANVREVWTFTRDLDSSDPTWRLADVAPEEGDALPADPAPDTTHTA